MFPADTASDNQLLERVAARDEEALAALYDRHGRAAYGLALRVVRDPALAEDAVQDAFLALWRSAGGFRPERGSAATWIATLVHRRAVDLVRREERRPTAPLGDFDPPAATMLEDDVATYEVRRAVQAALRRLPPEQRETLELAYYGGLTQSELADRLNVPLGTVKSRTFAALHQLRRLLAEPSRELAAVS